MDNNECKVSVIIPVYNSEKTISYCLKNIISESNKLESEIIVVDDASTDNTLNILKEFKNIKIISLEHNKGAGNARNTGANIAKYNNLCFVDSDIYISEDSIINLVKRLIKDDDVGSVSGSQNIINLNKDSWSSNFVCLKSCYGTDKINHEKIFSMCCSEFCVISKELFLKVGKWKAFSNAGGEEFDLGYKIKKLEKKNIKTKEARYSGYWCNLNIRFKRIIQRTEKYIPLLLKKKSFDSKGTFATFSQSLSSFITLIMIVNIFLILLFKNHIYFYVFLILYLLQLIIEFKFFLFAKNKFGFKMLLYSLYGIQVINLAIIIGFLSYIFKLPFNSRKFESK